jgi:hypothetical protein
MPRSLYGSGNENDSSPLRVQLSKESESGNGPSSSSAVQPAFHFAVKVISRSAHRCILHCVAYRSACRMRGGNGKIVADYTRRNGVIHCQIVTPDDVPMWANDRNKLWLEAAEIEKRKNSVEGREFEVTIPYGLSQDDAISLARDFAKEMVDHHFFVIDFSLHADNRKSWTGDYKNHNGYHVHFLATTRRIGPKGFGQKTREFDIKSSGVIKFWRKRWEEIANGYLFRAGLNTRIDHRSNKDRGISRPPTLYLGERITAMERRGVSTSIGNLNREIMSSEKKSTT